jgi:4a-hydroxytetrahydrobiopterin dehydratase
MNLRRALTEQQIEESLKSLPLWARSSEKSIVREIRFPDFKSALAFVNRVGEVAELADHHPDVELTWGKVRLSLTTHSEKALSALDFSLASSIDELPV